MQYRIQFAPTVLKALKRLPSDIQIRLLKKIALLSEQPRPLDVRVLKGQKGTLRIRVSDYRIIYQIDDENLLIRILKIAHRRDVYRHL